MRGKWAARAATMLALTWLVAPLFGQEDAEPPVELDLEVGGSAGQMSLIRPAGCAGPVGQNTNFLGMYGRLGLKSRPSSGPWQHRLVGEASGEARIHSVGEREGAPIGLARATVGWSSQYAGVSAGGWAGNVGENEELLGFASASIRLGLPDRHLKLSLFDQPACFAAHCSLGIEGLWSLDSIAFRLGFSGGLVGWRGFLQVPFQWLSEELWLYPGLEVGLTPSDSTVFFVTIGVGLPSL